MKKMITLGIQVAIFIEVATFFFTPAFAQDSTETWPNCASVDLVQSQSVTRCVWSSERTQLYIVRPTTEHPTNPPLLYLLGGPGSKGDVHLQHMAMLAHKLGRTVLMPDPANSFPSLECSYDDTDDAQWGISPVAEEAVFYTRPLQQARLNACLNKVRLNNELRESISTRSQVERLIQLRKLLDIPTWIIMGESYGGRLALELAAQDGQAVDRIILDSPETPWVEGFWKVGRNFYHALENLSDLCRSQYLCPAKRVHIERSLPEQIAYFAQDMVEPLPLKNRYTRAVEAYARPTPEQLFITTFMALRVPSRAALMPFIAASHDDETLKRRFGLLLSELLQPGGSLNMGIHHSIRCSELPLSHWYKVLEQEKRTYPELVPFLEYLTWRQTFVCDSFGIPSPARFTKPNWPAVPLLVLSGSLDPITPADVIAEAFSGRPEVTLLNYSSRGHVTHLQNSCIRDDIALFVGGQEIRKSTCSKKDLKLRFYTPVITR